jgi:hypothetical protein
MKFYLCVYSNKKFEIPRKALVNYSKKSGIFEGIFEYDRDWLVGTEFYKENLEILDDPESKGDGWCLWKPYVIMESLKRIGDGDVLIYMDATDTFFKEYFKNFLRNSFENSNFLLSRMTTGSPNIKYTKRDTFLHMGCDSTEYWNCPQLEAGVSGFRKCNETILFVGEYLKFCSDPRIIKGGKSNDSSDFPEYIEHRYDQSVLTNLSLKHGIKPNTEIVHFIECNLWESLLYWGNPSDFSRKLSRIRETCGGEESGDFIKWASFYLPNLFKS